jgi:hypothetical protein
MVRFSIIDSSGLGTPVVATITAIEGGETPLAADPVDARLAY